MLTISDLDKAFGARDLFAGAELQVGARDRVAVVGPNGAGKTTLFDMIAGEQAPDSGQIRLARDAVVGYLHQETDDLRGRTLIDEVLSVGSEVTAAGHRLALLESEMTELTPGEERDRLVAEYGRLQHRFETLGGYTLEAEAKRILGGLGFKEADHVKPTDSFSGGWLMRIALSKLLLASPDLLMLDEPTNHLDVESVEWLERFLRDYDGSVLLISHDRDFMNGLATKVVEIDRARLVSYTGNYQSFVVQREEAALQAEALGKHQARQIAQTEAFINRFRYKASKARQVQSRIKALEKLDRVESLKSNRKTMNLRFPDPPRSGRVVIELDQIDFAYGETNAGRLDGTPSKAVYNGLEFVMEREHKVALVGPNGAGKTTLLKLLAGVLEPSSGERRLGHNVNLGYFAQHQIEALEPKNRVLQELEKAMPRDANLRPRNLLGRFLFSGDDVDKPVSVLSGGERTRLALAKLLVAPFNVLCLDEPTNHLDIWSRDALEDALVEYAGAMVLITHDRHLIRQVANRIVEVVDGTLTIYDGDYDFYLSKRAPLEDDEGPPAPVQAATSDDRLTPKERRRIAAEARAKTSGARDRVRKIEKEMDKVATEMNRIEKLFADPEFYSSDADVAQLTQSYERAKSRGKKLEVEWEEAAGLLDS